MCRPDTSLTHLQLVVGSQPANISSCSTQFCLEVRRPVKESFLLQFSAFRFVCCWSDRFRTRGRWSSGLAEELHPRRARTGLSYPDRSSGDLLHLRRSRPWWLLRRPRAAVSSLPCVSQWPHQSWHSLPSVLSLPQRNHLQSGAVHLWLVVSVLSPCQQPMEWDCVL